MRLPVMNPLLEDWADKGIMAGAGIKASHQPVDHRLVDTGASDDVIDDGIAAGNGLLSFHVGFHRVAG